ncbi:major facilitator superfamily domain-containing protein [Ephemerocybe angulata]|uniref:Major facilitator superfamily domain-containing protein n=1 Tax=Ephemerocybe angulata TaxID=980116 RepID=A0A8H6HJ27_9AGAR|nr:major facilitator superfamily domain-containing protein [Tulosesus angulatus]
MARTPTGKELVEISEIEKADISQTPSPPSSPIASQLLTEINPEAERRLVKKLDWILLPLFTAIYCCNFIDRTSIGNAKVAGLEKDLGMHGVDLNVALTVFYIFYVIADIPSNLILKRFGSAWLAFLVIGFGVISLASAFLHNYAGLLASRIFLGLTEGGTLSGLVYIISRYYRKEELVLRVGIFFGVGPSIAGAFGGLLASGLLKLPDMGHVHTWRKIFLVEGLITTIFGLVLLFIVPEDPSKSRLLSVQERKLAMARIDAGQIVKTQGLKEKTTAKLVLRSFNLITFSCTLCFVLLNMSFQGLSLFLPSVIRSQGTYSTVEVQLRTVPPYVASAVWVVINAWVSARLKKRFLPILYNIVLVIIGYAISVSTKHPQTRYAACFLMIMGGSVGGPMLVTWGTDNAAPDTMRAVVTAAIPGIGAFGAVMAVWTYAPSDAPDYRKGNLANLSACSAIFVIVSLTALYIAWENRKRARGDRDHRLEGLSEKETMRLGYRHPRFRYQI